MSLNDQLNEKQAESLAQITKLNEQIIKQNQTQKKIGDLNTFLKDENKKLMGKIESLTERVENLQVEMPGSKKMSTVTSLSHQNMISITQYQDDKVSQSSKQYDSRQS